MPSVVDEVQADTVVTAPRPARRSVARPTSGAGRPLPGGAENPSDLADPRWIIGVWVVVALFAAVTAWRSHVVGIPLRDPDGQMFRGRLESALIMMAAFTVLDAVRRAPSRRSPRAWWATWRARWWGRRLALVVSGLVAYHCVYVCYRNLKSWDAFNTPHDDDLLALDRWLFLGHSPASLLHDVLGQHTSAYVLTVVYKSFTYFVPLSLVGALVFVTRIRRAYVFLAAGMWLWILGVASYYLIPTLGPFASDPGTFAGLTRTSITGTQEEYLTERAHLLAHPEAHDAFASISAFASLHVAFTTLIFLMLRYYGMRRLARVWAVYLAAVMVATVYFGWHFLVDVPAGVAVAMLSVLLARWLVLPRGTREQPAP
jgi:membrane-associated phospholipid phosphatase